MVCGATGSNGSAIRVVGAAISVGDFLMTKLFYFLLLILVVLAERPAAASDSMRDALARQDFYPEYFVKTLVIVYTGLGETELADCVDRWYFSNPPETTAAVTKLWSNPDLPFVGGVPYWMQTWCAKENKRTKRTLSIEQDIWRKASESHALKATQQSEAAVRAAFDALLGHSIIRKDKAVSGCLSNSYKTGAFNKSVADAYAADPNAHLPIVAYEAARTHCASFASSSKPGASIKMPQTPNSAATAAERLLAVQHLKTCDETDKASFNKCKLAHYETRAAIVTAVGDDIARELGNARGDYQRMLRNAWRLPDGRAIFQDKSGNWFDEDDNPVSAELASQRRSSCILRTGPDGSRVCDNP